MVLDKGLLTQRMIVMGEPSKKRCKLGDRITDVDLELLQEHLLQNCLCALPDNILQILHRWFHSRDAIWSDLTDDWSRDRVLLLITCIQLICDINMKQCAEGKVCQRLAEIRHALTKKDNRVIDFLMTLADCPDPFILFAASQALTSLFLVVGRHIDPVWLDNLTVNIVICEESSKISFSLDVLRGIIEWKDSDGHTLDDNSPEDRHLPAACHMLSVNLEQSNCNEVKCICIQSLGRKWPLITPIFQDLIRSRGSQYQSTIINFLNLWGAIVSVKANLSVKETEPFYVNLDCYVDLLFINSSAIVWKHILNVFNEVLCYGSTLSLQSNLDEKPCSLATKIIRNVKIRGLLTVVPYRQGSDEFGGTRSENEGDKVLLKKVALLVLKAVAVTVKAAKYDSSSDSSVGSEVHAEDADMAFIVGSIHGVIVKLDTFIKGCIEFHPETKLAEWIVQVFTDQDDYLIESMICCLDVAQVIGCCSGTEAEHLRTQLNPSVTFLEFLKLAPNFDASFLLDFLISNETNFLLYSLRILKYIIPKFDKFLQACNECHTDAIGVRNLLIGLRESVQRQVRKNLFPYNITPLIKKLTQFEKMYTQYA